MLPIDDYYVKQKSLRLRTRFDKGLIKWTTVRLAFRRRPIEALGCSQVTITWAPAERLRIIIKTLKPESTIVTIACMLARTVYML